MADKPTSPRIFVKELKDGTKKTREVTSEQARVAAEFEGFVEESSSSKSSGGRSSSSSSSSSS